MSARPKVLFVGPSAYLLGGVQAWLDYLLPGLQSLGWEPLLGLVSGRFHNVDRYVQEHPGHRFVAIDNPTGSREGRIQALIQVLRQTRPDVLVVVNIVDCYPAVERLRASGEAAPHVVMADHSVEADYLQDAKSWRHILDGFVGTNRLTLQLACDYAAFERGRVHYAPYGVPTGTKTVFQDHSSDLPLRIAYSGRVDEHQKRAQDIPAILAALERVGITYKFRLAGGGPYLDTLSARLGPQIERGTVEFLGVLNSPALDEHLYAWADVLLVTSVWETGPIVIWEAMARCLAVVSSRFVGSGLQGSLLHDQNCLLFPIGDATSAATQLHRAMNADLRHRLTHQAAGLVAGAYSREQSISAWNVALRQIAETPQLKTSRIVTEFQPSGRLDGVFGSKGGELVRRLLRRTHQHAGPGGEWPHTDHTLSASDERNFWEMATRVDSA